ncbi:MAG: DEAD/DEAH box helicase family protein, partial [Fibrobacter sp.]|nr:DEAD/DEAH box helicase family protein [Fibrobacter sp.]
MSVFTEEEILKYAFAAVVEDGRRYFSRGKVFNITFVGNDIIASVRGEQTYKVVVNREKEGLRFGCNCGFSFGGACEHVVAVMLAANEHQAIQIGIDWDSPVVEEPEIKKEPALVEVDESEQDLVVPPEDALVIEIEAGKPVGRLYLSESDSMLLVELRFAYHFGSVEFNRMDTSLFRLILSDDGKYYRIFRSKARESSMNAMLAQFELMRYQSGIYTPVCDPRIWILQELPRLAKEGFEIYGQEKLTTTNARKAIPKLSVNIKSEENVFDCAITISFDGISATLAELVMAVRQGSRFVLLTDGTSGVIPQEWLDRFAGLFAALDIGTSQNSVKIKNSHLALANLLYDMADEKIADEKFSKKREDFQNFSGIHTQSPPGNFFATMRPYQMAGYEWFYFLKRYHFGGCLADDMGLGKTVQTLALLTKEKESGLEHPSLVIVPTSLLFNWQREASKFSPGLRVHIYHGASRQKYLETAASSDVILTSYGTVLRDTGLFMDMKFHFIILDEAQAIKNPASQITRAIKQLQGNYRLALSGTPIENNLTELWSLFSFINPGMLGTYRNFAHNFVKPIERELNEG